MLLWYLCHVITIIIIDNIHAVLIKACLHLLMMLETLTVIHLLAVIWIWLLLNALIIIRNHILESLIWIMCRTHVVKNVLIINTLLLLGTLCERFKWVTCLSISLKS